MTQAPSPETPQIPEAETPNPPTEDGAPAGAAVAAPIDEALLRRALEGLLFITDRPLSASELGRIVGIKDQDKIVGTVEELRRELDDRNAGYRLVAVAEGWQMATRPELAPYMRKLFADRATMRLSTAAQETLSIVAYRQPLTRAEIEEVRGVEVIAALETLLEKRLVRVVGRKETVGRPLLYGTTPEFLRHFGLRNLEELPPFEKFSAEGGEAVSDGPAGPFERSGQPVSAQEPVPSAEPAPPASEEPAEPQ